MESSRRVTDSKSGVVSNAGRAGSNARNGASNACGTLDVGGSVGECAERNGQREAGSPPHVARSAHHTHRV